MKYTIDKKIMDDIPVFDIYPAETKKLLPMILFLHGFGSRKERKLTHAFYLAEAGYFVCALDAFNHGERQSSEFEALSNVEKQSGIFEIILDTSKSLNSLIDNYVTHPVADTSRIGLIGTSMGAMTIFHYITHFRRTEVKTAMPVIGTPVWKSNIKNKILEDLRLAPFFNDEKLEQIAKEEPAQYIEKIIDFPLLVQNGVDDELIPIEDIRQFAEDAKSRYIDKKLFELHDYYDVGHEATDTMIKTAISWCRRHLD